MGERKVVSFSRTSRLVSLPTGALEPWGSSGSGGAPGAGQKMQLGLVLLHAGFRVSVAQRARRLCPGPSPPPC